ncbi:MAG TPA: hypothetical protein VIQ24_16935, partial [Pyrinomonadaceae bacterium]
MSKKRCESSITFYCPEQFFLAAEKAVLTHSLPVNIAFSKVLPNWHGGCKGACAWLIAGTIFL